MLRLLPKKRILFALIILAMATLLLSINKFGETNNLPRSGNEADDNAQTTSVERTAQEDFKDGAERDIPAPSTTGEDGTVRDTGGNIDNTASDIHTTATDGAISVHLPTPNAMLRNGDFIAGTTSHRDIYFRLISDTVGVVAEGRLLAVNGKFSGIWSFNTSGTDGQVDIFSIDPSGKEVSNVAIPVRFK